MKDSRITYKKTEINLEGNTIRFDGKGNPEKKELKIYRIFGDIRLFNQAIQDFAIGNGYETVLVPVSSVPTGLFQF